MSKADEMKAVVRDFFIENYSHLTRYYDVKVAAERNTRYEELLRLYMFLVEFNECKCFNSPEDILGAMRLHSKQDEEYIKNGVVTYQVKTNA